MQHYFAVVYKYPIKSNAYVSTFKAMREPDTFIQVQAPESLAPSDRVTIRIPAYAGMTAWGRFTAP
jgi:hypothetical protein